MKHSLVQTCAWTVLLALGLAFLPGCGSPPPPPKSAKSDIKAAEDAMEAGALMYKRQQYVVAQTFYETALAKISDGESYATGTELTYLHNLKDDARAKKIDCDSMALAHPERANKPAVVAEVKTGAAVLTEAALKEAEEKKAAEAQRKSLEAVASTLPSKSAKKPEAGDDTEPEKKTAKSDTKTDAAPAPKKDKNGIFSDVTESSPALQVVKLIQKGKFVVAYVQGYNKSPDGRRITVATFFKNRDNQEAIPTRTVASFPYEHFSTNVADLISDQSVHNLTPNSDEAPANSGFQFVCVGEANTDDLAKQVVKAYIVVNFNDGTAIETTGPENSPANAIPALNLK